MDRAGRGHLLKKQLLDPHWEKKKRAGGTRWSAPRLYGLVVYSGRRVNFGRVDPVAAREIFIREALVGRQLGQPKYPFLAANDKLVRR